jgi:hypothetical protein
MDPRNVAARFAAFVWFSNKKQKTEEAAVQFAQDNWPAFLPLAQDGLGRLLLEIAKRPASSARPKRWRRSAAVGMWTRGAAGQGEESGLAFAGDAFSSPAQSGSQAMYHTIEFVTEFMVDLERSPKDRLERLLLRKGTRAQAQLKPYVVETADGLVEVADVFFEDGTTARTVPLACFSFVD